MPDILIQLGASVVGTVIGTVIGELIVDYIRRKRH